MSRSNDVGAPCLNETWGSSSMSGWLFRPLIRVGFWNKKLGVLGALVRCSPLCSGHHRPLHDQWLGAVCGDFGNGRKLHCPMKDVCCLSCHLLKKYVAGGRIGPNQSRTDDRTLRD